MQCHRLLTGYTSNSQLIKRECIANVCVHSYMEGRGTDGQQVLLILEFLLYLETSKIGTRTPDSTSSVVSWYCQQHVLEFFELDVLMFPNYSKRTM